MSFARPTCTFAMVHHPNFCVSLLLEGDKDFAEFQFLRCQPPTSFQAMGDRELYRRAAPQDA
jgi:hypothetical protein